MSAGGAAMSLSHHPNSTQPDARYLQEARI
jgi:hypothetical protein